MSTREITGRQVFIVTAAAFGVIIAVNFTLAFMAVRTFPGLETKNSYVASQVFNEERRAQEALGWSIHATVADGTLHLKITDKAGTPVEPATITATLGRATHVKADQTPEFAWTGTELVAPVALAPGNWNLRMEAVAADGTKFRQRVVIYVDDADAADDPA